MLAVEPDASLVFRAHNPLKLARFGRRALAGATRSGTAGVGHLLAIRGKRYAVAADVL
jgi:hypothetical protein